MLSGEIEMKIRLSIAVVTCAAIPLLVVPAYVHWKRTTRRELPAWRNGAGLASILIILTLWLLQATRWAAMSVNSNLLGLLDRIQFETFLPALYAFAALPLAFGLKGIPRLQIIAAWFFVVFFYAAFTYV